MEDGLIFLGRRCLRSWSGALQSVGRREAKGQGYLLGGTYNFCALQNGNTKRGLFETRRRPNTYKDPPALGPHTCKWVLLFLEARCRVTLGTSAIRRCRSRTLGYPAASLTPTKYMKQTLLPSSLGCKFFWKYHLSSFGPPARACNLLSEKVFRKQSENSFHEAGSHGNGSRRSTSPLLTDVAGSTGSNQWAPRIPPADQHSHFYH